MVLRSRHRLSFECRLLIQRLSEVCPRPIERTQELPEAFKAQVLGAALDRTDVGTIKVCEMGKPLLRDAQLFPPPT